MEISVQGISDFVRSTTAHGFSRIHSSESLPVKLMWTLFLVTALGGFSYHLSQLVLTFMSTPVSANISPGAIPFETPDITVCGVTPISYSNYYETVAKHPSVYANLYSSAAQLAYISTMVGLGGQYETLMPIAKDMFDPSFLLRYLGTRQEYFIVKCTYKGYNCSFTDFENYWVSKYGNCFRFSPSATLLNQTKEIAEFSLELVLFTDNYPVLGNPESLTIYGRLTAGVTYEGIYDVSKSGGAILFYGEKDHFPRDYINLSPGVHSYVDFEMVEYHYVSRNSKKCNPDDQSVYYEDAVKNRIKFVKGKQDCQYRQLLEKILNDCKCLSSGVAPAYANATEVVNGTKCHYISMATNATEFKRRTQCEYDYLLRQSTLFNEMTECVNNCKERIYTPILSMASWPLNSLAVYCKNNIMQDHINRMLEMNYTVPDVFYYFRNNLTTADEVQTKFASNFAQISLGAYRSFSMMVEEVEAYMLSNLFSDIGGILGLYLGMSVLTICELFELMFVISAELRTAYQGYKERIEWKTKFMQSRALTTAVARFVASARSRSGANNKAAPTKPTSMPGQVPSAASSTSTIQAWEKEIANNMGTGNARSELTPVEMTSNSGK